MAKKTQKTHPVTVLRPSVSRQRSKSPDGPLYKHLLICRREDPQGDEEILVSLYVCQTALLVIRDIFRRGEDVFCDIHHRPHGYWEARFVSILFGTYFSPPFFLLIIDCRIVTCQLRVDTQTEVLFTCTVLLV